MSDAVEMQSGTGQVAGMAEFVAFHAARRPDHPAIADRGRIVSYGQFMSDLQRTVRALAGLDISGDSFVAVEWDGLYRHWLLLLALEARGIPSFSYAARSTSRVTSSVVGLASMVFWSCHAPQTAKSEIRVDEAWWAVAPDQTDAGPDLKSTRISGLQPLRILCSSGTTAEPKIIAPTAAQMAAQRQTCQLQHQFSATSRYLVGKGFFLQADYRRACCCLQAGGTVIYGDDLPVLPALTAARATHVALLPLQIEALAEQTRDLSMGPDVPKLHIAAIGGRVPPTLRLRLVDSIASDLLESYGTNETGSIATVGPDGLATPVPGMLVEIVNDAGSVLPSGEPGHIRVKGAGCVTRYPFHQALTAQRFRDGWFYPGDIGTLNAKGQLRLIGRSDDLLNIGGLKINAPDQEALYKTIPGIQDVALTSQTDAHGIEIPCIVVVKQDGFDTDRIKSALTKHGVGAAKTFALAITDAIPRTETGKIRRNFLKAELAKN